MHLSGTKSMVVGLGETGLAVVRFLRSRRATILVNDQRDAYELGDAAAEAEALGAELILGGHPADAFENVDLVIVSPGFRGYRYSTASKSPGFRSLARSSSPPATSKRRLSRSPAPMGRAP